MSMCEKQEACPFFNDKMENMPSVAALLKQKFCMADKEGCARYMVASSGLLIPSSLFPNQLDKAKCLIASRQGLFSIEPDR